MDHVTDNIAPSIVCPKNVTAPATGDKAEVKWPQPTVSLVLGSKCLTSVLDSK